MAIFSGLASEAVWIINRSLISLIIQVGHVSSSFQIRLGNGRSRFSKQDYILSVIPLTSHRLLQKRGKRCRHSPEVVALRHLDILEDGFQIAAVKGAATDEEARMGVINTGENVAKSGLIDKFSKRQ